MSDSPIVTDANDFDFAICDELGQEVQVGLYNAMLVGAVDLAIYWILRHRAGNPGMLPSASVNSVGTPVKGISRLNIRPARTPVNASPLPSRAAAASERTGVACTDTPSAQLGAVEGP